MYNVNFKPDFGTHPATGNSHAFPTKRKKEYKYILFLFLNPLFSGKINTVHGIWRSWPFFHIYKQILFLNSLSLNFRQYEHSPSF